MIPDLQIIRTFIKEDIRSVDFLTRGQTGPIYTIQTSMHKYVLKTSKVPCILQIEANMLRDLKKYDIVVPPVHYVDTNYLLMDFISESMVPEQKRDLLAAETVAKLHNITNENRMYGYWYDSTIGPFPQKNEQTQYNWSLFLGQMRIIPMMKICYDQGIIDRKTVVRLEILCRDMYKRIDMSMITPSLIHGDLWSGNILFQKNQAILVDPALYFADREMELAFILMFNTFGNTFFKQYTQIHPLSEDFYEVKVPLYQIYPILVHAALYGNMYTDMLKKQLNLLKV